MPSGPGPARADAGPAAAHGAVVRGVPPGGDDRGVASRAAAGPGGRRRGRRAGRRHPTRPPRPSASPCACAQALETPGKRAALVTTNRGLGRRVAAELLRWGVRVDDSAGVPLDQSPPGSFLLLTAQLAARRCLAGAAAGGAQAPAGRGGIERARVPPPGACCWSGWPARHSPRGRAARAWQRSLRGRRRAGRTSARVARRPIAAAARPLDRRCWPTSRARLGELLEAHLAFAEWLAADATGDPGELWAREAGRCAREFVDELAACGDAAGDGADGGLPGHAGAADGRRRRSGRTGTRHPRLAILGQLEARLIEADLVVLGDLNEGSWPPPVEVGAVAQPRDAPASGPAAGRAGDRHRRPRLPGRRRRAASSCSAGPPRTRTARPPCRRAGSPGCRRCSRPPGASRRSRPQPAVADWARRLDQPAGDPRPVPRPRPCPPAAARPRELWATDVERLMRDPYAVYARRILGLDAAGPDRRRCRRCRARPDHPCRARRSSCGLWPDRLPDDPRAELLRAGRAGISSGWPRARRSGRCGGRASSAIAAWFAAGRAAPAGRAWRGSPARSGARS